MATLVLSVTVPFCTGGSVLKRIGAREDAIQALKTFSCMPKVMTSDP